MTEGLKSKTIDALFWSFLDRFGRQGIRFVISIILARLLLPEEFGLIGMLTIFIAMGQTFVDSGFGQALIQKKNADGIDKSTIFYFNIFVSFLITGLLFIAAPWIADFYNSPILIPITRVISLNFIFEAFGMVQAAILTRRIDFKTQLKINLLAMVVSGAIGITLALRGFGVWSLVIQSLSSSLFRSILLWVFNKWRPVFAFSLVSLRSMFNFGSKMLLTGLLNTFFQNIYLVIIGKLFSPADLGFYSRAKQTQQLPVESISHIVTRVIFPVFSTIQDDKLRLKRGVRQALSAMVSVSFPMLIGLAVVSKPLILVLLTEKWLPCVPYLRLLCAVGLIYPVHIINLIVLTSQGRSDLFLRLELIKKGLVVLSIAITYRWGISAMIWGQIMVSIIAYYINSYYTGRMINYPIREQIVDLMPYLGVSIIMGISIFTIQFIHFPAHWILLLMQITIGAGIYILLSYFFHLSAFDNIVNILWGKLKDLTISK